MPGSCCYCCCYSAQGHSHMHMDSVVKMKSLPFDATQLDIIQFFEQYKLKPNGVQLVVRSDNKPTGEVCASLACAGSSCVCAWQQFSGMPRTAAPKGCVSNSHMQHGRMGLIVCAAGAFQTSASA